MADAPGSARLSADPLRIACPWHGWEYDLDSGQSFMGVVASMRPRPLVVGRWLSYGWLRRPPPSGLSVVLPRVPRRQRDRHAEPASFDGGGQHVRRDSRTAWRAHRMRGGVGLRWSLDAAWRLMREDHPRLQRKPSEYPTSTCGSRPIRSRSPTIRSTWCTQSSRRGSCGRGRY